MSNILERANELIHNDRNKDYGHPLDDFTRTGKIWSAILGVPVSAEQVALCMVGVKMSRLCNSPDHKDSIADGAGYFGTYEMVRDERHTRATDMETFGPLEGQGENKGGS